MPFTAQEALDDQGTGDAIMLEWPAVKRLCRDHGLDAVTFNEETYSGDCPELVDAGDLFAWMGY
jgi:hypothetical protein